jgi:hypothetical protein
MPNTHGASRGGQAQRDRIEDIAEQAEVLQFDRRRSDAASPVTAEEFVDEHEALAHPGRGAGRVTVRGGQLFSSGRSVSNVRRS